MRNTKNQKRMETLANATETVRQVHTSLVYETLSRTEVVGLIGECAVLQHTLTRLGHLLEASSRPTKRETV